MLYSTAEVQSAVKRAKRDGGKEAGSGEGNDRSNWTFSPAALREALTGVSQAVIQFDLTDMHDAAEVSLCLMPVLRGLLPTLFTDLCFHSSAPLCLSCCRQSLGKAMNSLHLALTLKQDWKLSILCQDVDVITSL